MVRASAPITPQPALARLLSLAAISSSEDFAGQYFFDPDKSEPRCACARQQAVHSRALISGRPTWHPNRNARKPVPHSARSFGASACRAAIDDGSCCWSTWLAQEAEGASGLIFST